MSQKGSQTSKKQHEDNIKIENKIKEITKSLPIINGILGLIEKPINEIWETYLKFDEILKKMDYIAEVQQKVKDFKPNLEKLLGQGVNIF